MSYSEYIEKNITSKIKAADLSQKTGLTRAMIHRFYHLGSIGSEHFYAILNHFDLLKTEGDMGETPDWKEYALELKHDLKEAKTEIRELKDEIKKLKKASPLTEEKEEPL